MTKMSRKKPHDEAVEGIGFSGVTPTLKGCQGCEVCKVNGEWLLCLMYIALG
jgi:hypothetical protein